MASILCSRCGFGIHYHSEPQGIQYIYISKKDWNCICNSHFDVNAKCTNQGAYPKLYRTDTIEEDFSAEIIKVWRCPSCKSLVVFNSQGQKEKMLVESEKKDFGALIDEGVAFDDYLWDQITETAKPNLELKSQLPSTHVKVYEIGIQISNDATFSDSHYYSDGDLFTFP